jgi:hypothetical protein
MPLPTADTPLYNHPLPDIEQWLLDQGCEQDRQELHCWQVKRPTWEAEIWLDVDQLTVRYLNVSASDSLRGGTTERGDIQRSFKYSLSRQDVEDAVFSGP